jgi:hypothetical protein
MTIISPLDDSMNKDIDVIIAKLEQAKNTNTYFQRANAVKEIAEACNNYEFYWSDKLQLLME